MMKIQAAQFDWITKENWKSVSVTGFIYESRFRKTFKANPETFVAVNEATGKEVVFFKPEKIETVDKKGTYAIEYRAHELEFNEVLLYVILGR